MEREGVRSLRKAASLREHHAIPRPAAVIGGLALIPFPVLLILLWTAHDPASRDWFVTALLSYQAVVLALMGGGNWVLASGPYGRARIAQEWLIGFACLVIAWACLNVPAHFGMTVLIAAFFLLALRDVLIAEAAGIPLWLARIRGYVTAAAIVTGILALIRLIT